MKLVFTIAKGLIRDQNMRRNTMFVVVLAAVVMLFVGSTFLNAYLLERPFYFLAFWGLCAWLTILSLLLALYDLLVVRARARTAARELRLKILRGENRPSELD